MPRLQLSTALALVLGDQLGGVGLFTHDVVGYVGNLLAKRLRVYSPGLVVRNLLLSSTIGFLDGLSHGVGNAIGIHVHFAINVSGGSSDGLNQRCCRSQKTLLVCVENCNERHFWQVEALA